MESHRAHHGIRGNRRLVARGRFNLLIASRSTGVGEDATVVSPVVTSQPVRLDLANPFSCPNQRGNL